MAEQVFLGSVYGSVELKDNISKGSTTAKKAFLSLENAVDSGQANINNNVSKIKSGFAGIGGVMTSVASGVTLGLAAIVGATAILGTKGAANIESTRAAFEGMLGDAEKAKKLMSELADFAAETPFEFPELAEAGKKLLAFGIGAEDIQDKLRALGDVSALLNIPLSELSDIYGKIRVQGRVFAEDINQLQGRGIPVVQELAKQFGVTEEEVKKLVETGAVGFENIDQALMDLTGSSGLFFEGMKKQSLTFNGLLSTIQDNLGTFARQIIGIQNDGEIRKGSIFFYLKEGAEALSDPNVLNGLQGFVDRVIAIVDGSIALIKDRNFKEEFIQALGIEGNSIAISGILALRDAFAGLAKFISKNAGIITGVLVGMSGAFAVFQALSPVITVLTSTFSIFSGVIGLLAPIATSAGAAITGISVGLAPLAAGIGAVVAVVATLAVGFVVAKKAVDRMYESSESFRRLVDTLGQRLGDIPKTLSDLKSKSGGVLDPLISAFETAQTIIQTVADAISIAILSMLGGLTGDEGFGSDASTLADKLGINEETAAFIMNTFTSVGEGIRSFAETAVTVFNNVRDAITKIAEVVGAVIMPVFETLKPILVGIGMQLLETFERNRPYIEAIGKALLVVLGVFVVVSAFIIGVMVVAFAALILIIAKTVEFFLNLNNTISEFVSKAISKIAEFVRVQVQAFVDFWTKVGQIIGTVGFLISEFIGNVVKWFKELPAKISGALGDLKSQMGDKFTSSFENVRKIVSEWVARATEWGRNIGRAFVDGFKEQIDRITKIVQDAQAKASAFIKGKSPPEAGPWKDIDTWGENIGRAWAEGVSLGLDTITVPDPQLTQNISAITPRQSSGEGALGSSNSTINITGNFLADKIEARRFAVDIYENLKEVARSRGQAINLLGEPSIAEA